MPWSIEDTRPADPVLGDPSSVAALAATLRRTAAEIDHALTDVSAHRSRSRRHAARLTELEAGGHDVTASMGRAADRLSEHASELADALGLAHRIVERAGAAGLRVEGPLLSRVAGVQGIADPAAEQARDETLARLQRVLDAVLLDLDRARAALSADLEAERRRCTSR